MKNLNEILKKHEMWIRNEKGGERADLRGANLCGANLCGADLHGADLYGADLYGADLHGANLRGADLREANLYRADLCGANLYGADLRDADFLEANLYGVDLHEVNFYGANFYGAKNVPFIPMVCPDTGSFTGWKKCINVNSELVIVKLIILEEAKRSSGTTRKCRASKVFVKEIQDIIGNRIGGEAHSFYSFDFIYKEGDTIEVPDFCEDRFDECNKGIHFFINRQEAVNYTF